MGLTALEALTAIGLNTKQSYEAVLPLPWPQKQIPEIDPDTASNTGPEAEQTASAIGSRVDTVMSANGESETVGEEESEKNVNGESAKRLGVKLKNKAQDCRLENLPVSVLSQAPAQALVCGWNKHWHRLPSGAIPWA